MFVFLSQLVKCGDEKNIFNTFSKKASELRDKFDYEYTSSFDEKRGLYILSTWDKEATWTVQPTKQSNLANDSFVGVRYFSNKNFSKKIIYFDSYYGNVVYSANGTTTGLYGARAWKIPEDCARRMYISNKFVPDGFKLKSTSSTDKKYMNAGHTFCVAIVTPQDKVKFTVDVTDFDNDDVIKIYSDDKIKELSDNETRHRSDDDDYGFLLVYEASKKDTKRVIEIKTKPNDHVIYEPTEELDGWYNLYDYLAKPSSLSTGAIIAIVVSIVVLICLVIFLLWCCGVIGNRSDRNPADEKMDEGMNSPGSY